MSQKVATACPGRFLPLGKDNTTCSLKICLIFGSNFLNFLNLNSRNVSLLQFFKAFAKDDSLYMHSNKLARLKLNFESKIVV